MTSVTIELPRLSRRTLLRSGAAAALADQCGAPPVYPHTNILGVPLHYEDFLAPRAPAAIYSAGTYIDGKCGSEHGHGRPFDLTRIYINGTDGRPFNYG